MSVGSSEDKDPKEVACANLDETSHQSSRSRLPTHIGRYEIRELIGRGGFGKVYLAHDPRLDRPVALKVPKLKRSSRRQLKRFITEGRSLAQLHHPSIVPVFDSDVTEAGIPYAVSEFVDGVTLGDHLESNDASLRQRIEWVRQVGSALAYAHSEGVLHRDVKPDNILIERRTLRPKLIDFGLAKQQRLAGKSSLETIDGGILGTPAYMSPEQARGELKDISKATDQYSLGSVLYRCLTGKPAYEGNSIQVIAALVSGQQPVPIGSIAPDVPAELVAICGRAMRHHPAERFQDVADMASALQYWLDASLQTPPEFIQYVPVTKRRKRQSKASVIMIVLVSTLVIMLVAALIAASHSDKASSEVTDADDLTEQNEILSRSLSESRKELRQLKNRQETLKQEISSGELKLKAERKLQDRHRSAIEKVNERLRYARRIRLAHDHIRHGDFVSASVLVPDLPSKEAGWEVAYLKSLLHPERFLFVGNRERQVVNHILLSDRSTHCVVTCDDLTAAWDLRSGVQSFHEFWPEAPRQTIAVPESDLILVVLEREIRFLNLKTLRYDTLKTGPIDQVAVSVDGQLMAVNLQDAGGIELYSMPDGEQRGGTLEACDQINESEMYFVGKRQLGFVTKDGSRTTVVDVSRAEPSSRRIANYGAKRADVVGRFPVSASLDSRLTLFQTSRFGGILARFPSSSPRPTLELLVPELSEVNVVAGTSDGRTTCIGHADGRLSLWLAPKEISETKVAAAKHLATLQAHDTAVNAIDVSRDGRLIASGGIGEAKVWHASGSSAFLEIHSVPGTQLMFSTDSQLVGVAGED